MPGVRAWRLASLAVVIALGPLGACAVTGLNFVEDDRIDLVAPGDRDEVRLPVGVQWTADDGLADEIGSYAVLIDRAPPPPGRSVAWLFRDDDACANRVGCPDAQYLADRGVYVTSETSIVVERIPRLASEGRHDLHEATVILLDRQAERIGESAWSVEFELVDGRS